MALMTHNEMARNFRNFAAVAIQSFEKFGNWIIQELTD